MKAVCKKLFSLMLVAILLVSAVPFQALAAEVDETTEATVAATEAATEPAAQAEVVATEPAAQEAIDLPKDVVYIDFQLGQIVDGDTLPNYEIGVRVKSKIGSKVDTPSGKTALKVLAKALGTSEGYEFVRWYDADGNSFSSDKYITEALYNTGSENEDEKQIVDIFAEFRKATKTITLDANGGKVSTTKHSVYLGEEYGKITKLPVPTKANCEFLGWYKEDNTLVQDDTTVINLDKLTAKWSSAVYTVQYEAYASDWSTVFEVQVKSNTVLAVADGKFPSADLINSDFALEGWKIEGWEVVENGASVTGDKTKVVDAMAKNGVITIRPIYKKTITLFAADAGNTTRKLTVTLGKRIPALPNPGARDGFAFVSWKTENDEEILKANLSNVSSHPYYYPDCGDLTAQWAESVTVLLNIYTNGNLKTPTLTKYYEAPQEGFDLTEIDLHSIFPSYGNYDDKDDEKHGWYTQLQWANYVIGKPANEYEFVENPGEEGFKEFYIMLINKGASESSSNSSGNNYNTNHSTADKTNPTTGDQIFMAVTVLAVSACALALIFFYKKRQAK